MKRFSLLLSGLLVLFAACRQTPEVGPDLAVMEPGWNERAGGEETMCSDGSPYRFFVHPGDPSRLLIHFQGGGACWEGENCDLKARPTYDPVVDERDAPAKKDGIFNLSQPENPFAGYSMVFVPYCTGDVHLGNRTTTYDVAATDTTEAHTVTIRHKGFVNATAVLAWTFANFLRPARIVVTGSSAGAIPSPLYASIIADHYAHAAVVQVGDGAGGYRSDTTSTAVIGAWGVADVLQGVPGFEDLGPENFSYTALYIHAARRHPDQVFARYDTAEDEVQRRFLALAGSRATALKSLLDANRSDIEAAVHNVKSYVAGGTLHTILSRPEFYTYRVGGVRFRDWVEALIQGDPVYSVSCDACDLPADQPAD